MTPEELVASIAKRVLYHAALITMDKRLIEPEIVEQCVTTFSIYEIEDYIKQVKNVR